MFWFFALKCTGKRLWFIAWSCARGGLGWVLEASSPRGHWNGLPRGVVTALPKPGRVQEVFAQCSQTHVVTPGNGPVQGWELGSMILVGPFLLSLSCNSVLFRWTKFLKKFSWKRRIVLESRPKCRIRILLCDYVCCSFSSWLFNSSFDSTQKALLYSCLILQVGSVNTG